MIHGIGDGMKTLETFGQRVKKAWKNIDEMEIKNNKNEKI